MALAIDERRDFADFLDTLTPEQWDAPTLCDRWDVRHVVAHVVSYEQARPLALAATFLRAGFRPGRVNDLRLRVYEDSTPGQLVEVLRAHLRPRGLTARFGGGVGPSDCVIHHQDIRRALDLERSVPPERVRESLAVALRAPVLPARADAKGLRFEATDLDWSTGDGPLVTGAGEALLLALAGRAVALEDLSGPGLDVLRGRLHHR